MTTSACADCANCGHALPVDPRARYCPHCGQETALHPPTFLEFAHEFVSHYVAAEGALWRTLATLLLRPGRLTREYLAGRRRRYVLPLRLYLTASFLFFVLVKFVGVGSSLQIDFDARSGATPVAQSEEALRLRACAESGAQCNGLPAWAARIGVRIAEGSTDGVGLQRRLSSYAPYAVFLMLPVFAALMRAVYHRRALTYGAHFVFGLHMHALWFLALLLLAVLPEGADSAMLAAVALYGAWAMNHVYGGRWWTTLLRALLVTFVYLVLLVFASACLVALALWMR